MAVGEMDYLLLCTIINEPFISEQRNKNESELHKWCQIQTSICTTLAYYLGGKHDVHYWWKNVFLIHNGKMDWRFRCLFSYFQQQLMTVWCYWHKKLVQGSSGSMSATKKVNNTWKYGKLRNAPITACEVLC